LQLVVREVHPELCFIAWNGWQPIVEGKTTHLGKSRRSDLVKSHFSANAFTTIRNRHRNGTVADDRLGVIRPCSFCPIFDPQTRNNRQYLKSASTRSLYIILFQRNSAYFRPPRHMELCSLVPKVAIKRCWAKSE
jgi:hypothetical protein